MKRVLCILSNMNTGGAEGFLMKIYRNLDREKYQMDFCVTIDKNFYGEEIKKLGGKIYVIPPKSKNIFVTFNSIRKIVKNNKYENVLRIGEHSLTVLDLLAAKIGGAKNLILRSSNASSETKKKEILHKIFKFMPMYIPNVKIAPSFLAAEYTFGKKNAKNGKVIYLNNGLDVEKFKFNDFIRAEYRKNLNIENKFVIGHIGRFNTQKNHKFLIEVFKEIVQKEENSILLLIGEGNLEAQVKKQVKDFNLNEKVKFLGLRKDIPELLSVIDIFLFPSFYEGMPNTVIEAQTSGVPCLISNTITPESKITELVEFEDLKNSPEKWANHILDMKNIKIERKNIVKVIEERGYDIKDCVNKFVKYILS